MRIMISLTLVMVLNLATLWCAGAGAALADVQTRTVEYAHEGVALQGVMAFDDALSGPRPGVLVVHEWYGVNDNAIRVAKDLAGMGYVAFALDMYGAGVLAETHAEAAALAKPFYADRSLMRARALAGLEELVGSGLVDIERTAAIGFCFGGTTVLELARAGAPLRGVVSFHGGLGTPHPEDMARFRGEVLVLHGAEDPLVPAEEVAAFEQEMREAGVPWTLVKYGDAVHSFTNPEADSDAARHDPRAAARSFRHMQVFFDAVLNP